MGIYGLICMETRIVLKGNKMDKYRIRFNGRKNGALGIRYFIEDFVTIPKDTPQANIHKAVTLKVYDNYEHISNLTFTYQGEAQ